MNHHYGFSVLGSTFWVEKSRQLVSKGYHFNWEKDCGSLTVVGLDENWTLALRFQVSGVRPTPSFPRLV
jgi:hypothetical protein